MASLAFGLVGAAVGSAFGMPSLGFSVGSTLGGLLFPTKQPNTFGPQMGDLSVTSSAYGADIPYGFGTMRIAGNIIWASPIQEVVNKSKSGGKKGGGGKGGGGKGGGGGETTVYTYYGNWAVGFAHGPASSVTRIWFDGVLVYDSVTTLGGSPFGNGGAGGIDGFGSVTIPGLNFRFYKGDEEQVADPLIESWIAIGDVSPTATHGSFKQGSTPATPAGEPSTVEPGSQAVPGHRGLCYIVFENWCLTNSGNHIPMVTAEITFGVEADFPFQLLAPDTNPDSNHGLGPGTDVFAGVAVDNLRKVGFRASNVDGLGYIRRFDPQAMLEDSTKPITDVMDTNFPITGKEISAVMMGIDGYLYVQGPSQDLGPGVHSSLLVKVDPNSQQEVGRVDTAFWAGLVIDGGRPGGMCLGYTDNGSLHNYLIQNIFDGSIGLVAVDEVGAQPMQIKSIEPYRTTHTGIFNSAAFGAVPDPTQPIQGHAWALVLFGPRHAFGSGDPVEVWGLDAIGGTFEKRATFVEADFVGLADVPPAGAGMYVIHGLWLDASTASILFGMGIGSDEFLVSYDVATKSLNYVTNITAQGANFPPDTGGSSIQSVITNRTLAWAHLQPNVVTVVDTLTGEVRSVTQWPDNGSGGVDGGLFGQQIFDGFTSSILGANALVKIFIDRHNPTDTTVGTIVRYMCQRAGLQLTDLDTAGSPVSIDDIIIKGYFIGQPTSTRDAILPLCQAYLFDVIESDGVLKFPLRGTDIVRDLVQAHDLAPVDPKSNLVVLETRAQEVDLPVYLAVSYYDGNNNYQQGTRIRRRSAVPIQNDPSGSQNVPTAHSQNVAMLQWPIVLDAHAATVAADKYLYATWLERTAYKQKLHWGHVDLDPSDVVTFTLDDGTTYTERLTKLVLGSDLSLECDGTSESSAVYGRGTMATLRDRIRAAAVAAALAAGASQAEAEKAGDDAVDGIGVKGGDDFVIIQDRDGPSFTKLLLLPTPLLDDSASAGQENSVLFYGASNYSLGRFPGCGVFSSSDRKNWTLKDTDPFKAGWGSTGSVLPDLIDPFSWDDTSRLRVHMRNGAVLENATDEELLDGHNAMAVFNRDGNPEVIQFGTASLNTDGSFTLSHLLRGRRGTDTWTTNHMAGGKVVVLDTPFIRTIGLALSDLDQVRYYKGVGAGLIIDFSDTETMKSPGNDLKPYAPVHVAASNHVTAWDPAADPGHWTVTTGGTTENDRAIRNAVDPGVAAYVTTKGALASSGRCYIEVDTNNGLDEWGMAGSSGRIAIYTHSTFGPSFGGRFAIDLGAKLAWVMSGDGTWLGAGLTPGNPALGTNGVDFSSLSGPLHFYAQAPGEAESTTLRGKALDQTYSPPTGFTAGLRSVDIAITWVRRTRIGGGLHDAVGEVPLSEGSEVYDVEILAKKAGASAAVASPGSSGSYVPNDVLTLVGGSMPVAPAYSVTTTKAIAATVAAGGSGGANGAATLTGTTGGGTRVRLSGTIVGGALTGPLTIVSAGAYTANPTDLAAEPVTGGGLTGATVALTMGVATVVPADPGAVDIPPANPVPTTNSGSATGATLNVTYEVGTVKRTYAGVTEPTKTYPAADVTADWGAIPDLLTLRVYQLSSVPVVGRGFTQETTVEVD